MSVRDVVQFVIGKVHLAAVAAVVLHLSYTVVGVVGILGLVRFAVGGFVKHADAVLLIVLDQRPVLEIVIAVPLLALGRAVGMLLTYSERCW